VQILLEGVRRSNPTNYQRLPNAPAILARILENLPSVCSNLYLSNYFRLPLLGVGEITVSKNDFKRTLQINGLLSDSNGFNVHLPYSKTDQIGAGVNIKVSPLTICPLKAMPEYTRVRPSYDGPLLIHYDKKPLSRYQFSVVLKKVIANIRRGIYKL